MIIRWVLDHVRDAKACMDNVVRVTRPGGWLIIGQDLTSEDDLEKHKTDPGLVGHPIKLKAEWFEPWLNGFDHPEIYRILPRPEGREPANHYGTLLFAGKKPGKLQ
jgi:hypothetical protein